MKNFFILFIVITSFSSYSQTKLTDVNLKSYFWQISDYKEPKVLVYDIDSMGTNSRKYLLLKKVSDDKLSVIEFNKRFKETYYIIDRFTDSCVFLDKVSIVEDLSTKEKTDITINEGIIWYNNFTTPISIKTTFTPLSDSSIDIEIENNIELVELTKKTINGKPLNTIIAKGITKMKVKNIISNEKNLLSTNTEIWYTEGIGITMTKNDSQFRKETETLVKIISIDEFNKLRGIKK